MNQKKFQYNDYEEDVVRASQYIFLEDEGERHAIFNFHNQFTEAIKSLTFFAIQYDDNDEILNKAKLKYDGFKCDANTYFVPKLKLVLNDDCERLEIYVVDATFDNYYLIDGVVHEIHRESENVEGDFEVEDEVLPYYFDVNTITRVANPKVFLVTIFIIAFLVVIGYYFIFGINEAIV